MTIDPEQSYHGSSEEEESTPLLFPSLRPVYNYKDPLNNGFDNTGLYHKDIINDKSNYYYGTTNTPFHVRSPLSGNVTFKQFNESVKQTCGRYLGILLAIFASFLLSLTTLIARVLIEYHPFNEAMWRFFGIFIPSVPILLWETLKKKEPVFSSIFPLTDVNKLKTLVVIFIRAFCGCTAVIFQFYALNYIEIGDVTVISFTTPVFVSVLAYFFLGEKLGFVSVIMALLTLLGIGIISRPPILSGAQSFDPFNLIGVALAFGCMCFATFTYVALRWLKPVHFALVTFFYGLISVVGCGISAVAIGGLQLPLTFEHWLLAIALGGLAFAGQSMFTLALKFEQAGPVALIRTCEVIFTFLWQIMFLDQLPDAFSIIGAALILICVLVTALRKLVMEMPDGSPTKTRFQFLLK